MFIFQNKLPFLIVACGALIALATAYGAEFIFGLRPCELCYYQRYFFYALFLLSSLFFVWIIPAHDKKWIVSIIILAGLTLGNAGLATYQVLVEQKIVPAPKVCRAKKAATLEELRASLEKGPPVSCAEIPWELFGVSMAGYGILYNLTFFVYLLLCLQRRLKIKRENP